MQWRVEVACIPCSDEVRVIVHYPFADNQIHFLEVFVEVYSTKRFHVRPAEDAVQVVHVRSVYPFRITNEERLAVVEVVFERLSRSRRTANAPEKLFVYCRRGSWVKVMAT